MLGIFFYEDLAAEAINIGLNIDEFLIRLNQPKAKWRIVNVACLAHCSSDAQAQNNFFLNFYAYFTFA
jgi:hypothetical protein